MKLSHKLSKYVLLVLVIGMVISCSNVNIQEREEDTEEHEVHPTSLVILGTTQDAGSPQIACRKSCCKSLFSRPDETRKVVSLGLIDANQHKTYLFEATPNIASQMKRLTQLNQHNISETVDGVFLTHAHIGHYTGLMHLGKEAMDAKSVPVYVMPKMKNYLTVNGPWSQLVKRKNIQLMSLQSYQAVKLTEDLSVKPFLVPHRDEYSETVGYHIQGPSKSALFIPDIDKWDKWETDIIEEIKKVDYAFLDATFFDTQEINNRDISEIPHPFVIESLEKFEGLSKEDKSKIIFIHFNHTNPLLNSSSEEFQKVLNKGFKIARFNQIFEL